MVQEPIDSTQEHMNVLRQAIRWVDWNADFVGADASIDKAYAAIDALEARIEEADERVLRLTARAGTLHAAIVAHIDGDCGDTTGLRRVLGQAVVRSSLLDPASPYAKKAAVLVPVEKLRCMEHVEAEPGVYRCPWCGRVQPKHKDDCWFFSVVGNATKDEV